MYRRRYTGYFQNFPPQSHSSIHSARVGVMQHQGRIQDFLQGGARFFRYIKVTKKVQKIFKKGTKKICAQRKKKNAREARKKFLYLFFTIFAPPLNNFRPPLGNFLYQNCTDNSIKKRGIDQMIFNSHLSTKEKYSLDHFFIFIFSKKKNKTDWLVVIHQEITGLTSFLFLLG